MVIVKKYKKNNETWLKFRDRFNEPVGDDMTLENWIETQRDRYDPHDLQKFLKKNNEFLW